MNAKSKTTSKPTFVPIAPSSAPGGYISGPELDRANSFAKMRFDLEQALTDRATVVEVTRAIATTFDPEFTSHGGHLLDVIRRVDAGQAKPRDVEAAIDQRLEFFKTAESFVLSSIPRHPDESQIHAAALHEKNKAEADKYRVRHTNY